MDVNMAFSFKPLEKYLFELPENHDDTTLAKIRIELDAFFTKVKCREVRYTTNTDKLFFGIKVYPMIDGSDVINLLTNEYHDEPLFSGYYVEFDSKLFDPMVDLTGDELLGILLYSIYHSVYDDAVINEIIAEVDRYMAITGTSISTNASRGCKELLAYGFKDALCKAGSVFTKADGYVCSTDGFVVEHGYGPSLLQALKKVCTNIYYMQKDIDARLITLSWAMRVCTNYDTMRAAAYRTLVKAKDLTGSALEYREIVNAADVLNHMETVTEGFLTKWKRSSIRGIQADVFELQLRLRSAEEYSDLLSILRAANSKIIILRDYLDNENLSDQERADVQASLDDLYSIRQNCAKDREVKSRYSGYIQVNYPGL